MAGPTTQQLNDRLNKQEELVSKLEGTVRVLEERLDNAREDVKDVVEMLTKLTDSLSKTITQQELLGARCTALEKTIDEIKKSLEERDRKLWALWLAILVAFLALLGNLAVALFRKN